MSSEVDPAIARLRRAHELTVLGRDAQAMDVLLELARRHPEADVLVQLQLTETHLAAGRHDEALDAARNVMAGAPQLPEGHLMAGLALRGAARPRQALAPLEQAVRLDPRLAVAHSTLAVVLSDLGRSTEAHDAADEGVRLAPDDPAAHFAMGYVHHQADPPRAAEAYRTALQLDPGHTLAKHNLAGLDAEAGLWDSGARGMADVLADGPDRRLPLIVLDQRIVQVQRRVHWISVAWWFLGGLAAAVGAWTVLGVVAAGLVVICFVVVRGLRPIRRALPGGGQSFLKGFPRRERLAALWLALLALFWVVWIVAASLDASGAVPGARWVGRTGIVLLLAGGVVSWIRRPLLDRRVIRAEGR